MFDSEADDGTLYYYIYSNCLTYSLSSFWTRKPSKSLTTSSSSFHLSSCNKGGGGVGKGGVQGKREKRERERERESRKSSHARQ